MKKILFVCHGNICRSPMAEFIFKDLVRSKRREKDFIISSCATSREEIGSDMYPPAKKVLRAHNIPFSRHYAHQMTLKEYEESDLVLVMDRNNLRNAVYLSNGDPEKKIRLLLNNEEIEDPWYTGNFEYVFNQIKRGCELLLDSFK